jgi:fucose 4-O-acetylase-like acetyltransferase
MQGNKGDRRRWGFSVTDINAVKGFFICLIVLGHITVFSKHFLPVFNVVYNYHVASFFFLSFLLSRTARSESFVADRMVRYLVPFYAFVIGISVLYYLIYVRESNENTALWAANVGIAMITGSEEFLDRACGLRALWFLPALFSLTVVKYVYDNSKPLVRGLILIAALAVHLLIGTASADTKALIPFGIHIALFVFPLALLTGEVCRRVHDLKGTGFRAVTISLWVACTFVGIYWGSYSAIAGGLNVYSIYRPARLLFHDVYAVAPFFAVLSCSNYLGILGILPLIGRHSLTIFLFHSLVWHMLSRSWLWEKMSALEIMAGGGMQSAVAFIMVISFSLMISLAICRIQWLSRTLFPRTVQDWPFTALWTK